METEMEIENTDSEDSNEQTKVPARTLAEQPGGLRSETRMTIQTRQAQKLVQGRKRGKVKKIIRGKEKIIDVQAIVGLLDFGRRMKLLWLSAQADDPYADWFLLRIEESINEAKAVIIEKKKWLDDVLNSMQAFEINVAQSLEPIQVPIVFQNPYGYMGAYLISEYDGLCCSIYTASHLGLIDRKIANSLTEATSKSIRRTFDLSAQWKFTGVTRDDIQFKNPVAISVIEAQGECPEPILSKEKRAKIAPEIRGKQKPVKVTQKKNNTVENIKPVKTEDTVPEDKKRTAKREAVAEALSGMG